MRAEGHANPFSLAYRDVVLDSIAKKLGVSREHLEKTLVEQGVYKITDKAELLAQHSMPHHMPVPTASGRIEFFSSLLEDLRAKGGKSKHFSVLAAHIPANCRADKSMDEPLGADEFYFTFGKAPTVSHGSTNANNPILSAINRFKEDIYTGIWIHPQRAEKLGIASGDSIRLSNVVSDQQQASGRAYLTRMVQPDTLFMYSAFGTENPALTRAAGFGTSTTKLIPYQVDPLVAGFRSQEFTLRVAKA
jgi:anaerobic selenocysteine-containing dehydrogenase